MIKLYTIEWNVPSIWQDTGRQQEYDKIVGAFSKWPELFTIESFDENSSYLRPVTPTRDTITDDELLELMTDDMTKQALGRITLVKTIDKFAQVAEPRLADAFNERVEVHMPGNALLTYNRTLLLEDACTNYLQEQLDDGWRIIAACPQPDQRRPDYILGRYEP